MFKLKNTGSFFPRTEQKILRDGDYIPWLLRDLEPSKYFSRNGSLDPR